MPCRFVNSHRRFGEVCCRHQHFLAVQPNKLRNICINEQFMCFRLLLLNFCVNCKAKEYWAEEAFYFLLQLLSQNFFAMILCQLSSRFGTEERLKVHYSGSSPCILVKLFDVKFHENPFVGSRAPSRAERSAEGGRTDKLILVRCSSQIRSRLIRLVQRVHFYCETKHCTCKAH
jgi:hypothetical protein